jgi:hypothetical protein
MANSPTKMQDPTEAALSAIQEALNIGGDADEGLKESRDDGDLKHDAQPVANDAPPVATASAQTQQSATEAAATAPTDFGAVDIFDISSLVPRDDAKRAASAGTGRAADAATSGAFDGDAVGTRELSGETSPPANDDRESIGQILRALQRRPLRSSYIVAGAFSTAWVLCCLGLSWAYLPELTAAIGPARSPAALMIGLGGAALLPVIFFFGVAHMVWRAQELRLIAQSMARVAMRLAEPESVARDSIVTVGQAVRREVAALGDGVERALARASELDTLVQGEVSALERVYSENELRIRGLVQNLATQREKLVGQAEQIRAAINGVHVDLSQDLSSIGDIVGQQVDEAAQRITQSLAEKSDHITFALNQISDNMLAQLSDRGGDLLDRLESTSVETSRALSSASDRLTASLNFKTDHISEEFAEIADGLEDMMNARLDRVTEGFSEKSLAIMGLLVERSQELTDSIVETSSQMAETIVARGGDFNNAIKASGDSLISDLDLRGSEVAAKLQQTGSRLTDTLLSRATVMADTVRENSEQVADVIVGKGEALQQMLAARLTAFEEMFGHAGSELGERISRDSSALGNLITRYLTEFDRTVKTYGAELVERLGARTYEVSEAMRAYVDNFDGRVTAKADEVKTALEARLARFEEVLDSRVRPLPEALSATVVEVSRSLGERSKEIVSQVDKRIGEVATHLDASAARLTDAVSGRIAKIDESLGKGALGVANTLDRRVDHLEELLTGRAGGVLDKINALAADTADALNRNAATSATMMDALNRSAGTINETIDKATAEAERKLVGMSTEVSRNIIGKTNEINTAMTQRAEDIARVLDDKSGALIVALSGKGEHFAGEVARVTDQAVKALDAKGFLFTQTMMDKSEEMARLINDAGQTATTAVTRTLGQMQEGAIGVTEAAKITITRSLEELHRATKAAIEESKQATAATVAGMLETHTMLRSDSTALFERLREANILLQEVLSGAQENMSSIEHTMATRVSDFVAAMNDLSAKSGATTAKVEQNLGTFNTVTAKVLTDISALADQFNIHGRTLTDAVDALEDSSRRTSDSLVSRHSSMESLVASLDARTEDFGQRIERFASLLDESLETATARAREIASVVAESSGENVQIIEQQYELIRKTANEERLRTGDTLRAIYNDAASETEAMFNQSAGRFTEIMQGMKQMAADMQRELQATRAELRRGILELPQETAETTAQMRRVIVDQIEALAELNRIVARHGRSIDAAEPLRAEPVYAAGSSGRGQARPVRADAGTPPPGSPRDITGAPPRRSGAPALSSVPGGRDENAGRGGWLSDILTRASREPGPQPARETAPRETARDELPRDMIDSIDSLSVDIARMIDQDAAAEIWDRYKRGEPGVFTRRLYTAQGQKAFDEIRAKYRADPEFRQTVEHYIHEFERLLDDVSRGDRGPTVARNYLTSDTGKVYTMLAHAAGRFD